MNAAEIRGRIIEALSKIAPEIDPATIDDRQPLRDSLDLDSMDFLNLLITLARELHVEIPERDYSKLQSLSSLVEYLTARLVPPG